MDIKLNLCSDFERTLDSLRIKYGSDFEIINGVHPSQLDYTEFLNKFTYNDTETQIILVKNPAGFNQIMSYLSSLKNDYVAVFCLNDKTADGHDISWIWDADYEKITQDPYCKQIFVSGTRANDMKVRLKYADAPDNDIILINDKNKLIKEATASQLPVYFLPNYTSMLELRSVLSAATGRREFWKDPKAR